jgi:hypothetical protein
MRRAWPTGGCRAKNKQTNHTYTEKSGGKGPGKKRMKKSKLKTLKKKDASSSNSGGRNTKN